MDYQLDNKFRIGDDVYYIYNEDVGTGLFRRVVYSVTNKKIINNIKYDFLTTKFVYRIDNAWVLEEDIFSNYDDAVLESLSRSESSN